MIINGKKIAENILHQQKQKIAELKTPPHLAVILVGDNPASSTYVKLKKKSCAQVGIISSCFEYEKTISEQIIVDKIKELNSNATINGILVQLPLPSHIDTEKIMETIDPKKDVDGFHPVNMGKLLLGRQDGLIPATAKGIKMLMDKANVKVEGNHVVIVGRSNIVGKPVAALLMQRENGCNATVTIAHSATKNLKDLTKLADILIVAIGKPKFITANMIKEKSVVIDVGINHIEQNGKKVLCGDVDFEGVLSKVSLITPVPGGVGPMTIAALLENTLIAQEMSRH